jgi:hypothetical protein
MFMPKNFLFPEETRSNIYLGQDPDPDLVKICPDPQHCSNQPPLKHPL